MDNNIWFTDFNLLFNKDNLINIIPTKEMSSGEKINSITRFALYFSLLLYLCTGNYLYFYIIIVTLVVTYVIYIFNNKESFNENGNNISKNCVKRDKIENCKTPTDNNPLMNPLLGDDPQKNKEACDIKENKVLEKVDKTFCDRLYQNTSNIFSNRFNQHAFYTVPNTKVPGDQTKFAKWLYNTPVSCEVGEDGSLKQFRSCALNNQTLEEVVSNQ